jgi:hypothetical protein
MYHKEIWSSSLVGGEEVSEKGGEGAGPEERLAGGEQGAPPRLRHLQQVGQLLVVATLLVTYGQRAGTVS